MELLTDRKVCNLLKKQKEYFSEGNTFSYQSRKENLFKLKKAILAYQPQLEKALAEDLGKNKQESYSSEIGFVLYEITHTIKNLAKWMKPETIKSPLTVFLSKSQIYKQPYGSVLIIGPFNYPFQLLIEPLVAAMSAGNCAVLSPSELTPRTAKVIKEMISQNFPREYISCVDGGIENNTVLIRNRFDKIFFTGSSCVGKIVMRAAAENLVPVTLELGGKSPVIVGESAKLKTACERIVWGKFMNAGQTCVAPDYIFVYKNIFKNFIEILKETIVRFYGENIQNNLDYGRIVNERHYKRLVEMLEKDKVYLVFGGETNESDRFISPSVLCPPNPKESACMGEEIFGPLLPVFPYENIEDTLCYINEQEKPLALYVFSEDKKEISYILQRTSSGGVSINDTVSQIINTNLPFGGIGYSGMGNYHGKYGFLNFTHLRSVLTRSTRFNQRIAYPPFTPKKLNILKKYMK